MNRTTTKCFVPLKKLRVRLARKTSLSPPPSNSLLTGPRWSFCEGSLLHGLVSEFWSRYTLRVFILF